MPSGAITTGPGTGLLASKKERDNSTPGVTGVAGDDPSTEESSLLWLRKLLSIVEKSESFAELIEAPDEAEIDLISGAFRAWTFVVLMSSVGKEIISLLIVPAAYLTVPDLLGVVSSRFIRFVNALASDIVVEA